MKGFTIFDGAMGTMLQARGLKAGAFPETYNLTHPDVVRDIHRAYVEAGAEVVTANTFGANPFKMKNTDVESVIKAGVRLAKESGAKKVALDVSAHGALLEPNGTLSFDEAYENYKKIVTWGAEAGADIILIETMSDLLEAKCALLAAKENTSLPVYVTMTYMEDGRTFLGTDPVTATITLSSLGADAVGVNCSLGAADMLPLVEKICAYAPCPVIVQPNAGLPKVKDGKTYYEDTPEIFSAAMEKIAEAGVTILGGCCGTTPEHITALKKMLEKKEPVLRETPSYTAATSATKTVFLGEGVKVIGERLNPTGKKKLKAALLEGDIDYILKEAIDQERAGADILDVNVGLPELDEAKTLVRVTKELQGTVSLPLQLDSSSKEALERACRIYAGKPIINSVNLKKESLDAIVPIAKKYGATLVGLCLGDTMPKTHEERYAFAEKLVAELTARGIKKSDIIIDCLVLTIATDETQAEETALAVEKVTKELDVRTVLGVSNVSFGMPDRLKINAAFLGQCIRAGLSAPILNPLVTEYAEVLQGKLISLDTSAYFTFDKEGAEGIRGMIFCGVVGGIEDAVREALKTREPLDIINEDFIPALDEIGVKFEKGEVFLPRLIAAAEVVKRGMDVLRTGEETTGEPDVILATVKGDIHDIGKNIVKMLLQSYGYKVLDLGKDVDENDVVDAWLRTKAPMIGLSALMTTTVPSMKRTIDALRAAGSTAQIAVGGAVLTPEYAKEVGADFYGKDARETVKIAEKVIRKP
ncbi:MAG: homocysteine S-methyltransferase family protein [Clostridia bacterium]|nr:homocysteine S-methyltransferase family protein [Clostridia bacterium]